MLKDLKESINHPEHYGGKDNPFEAIKVIEALGHGFSFCIGNALKYLLRAGKKDPAKAIEDLKKSVWYLDRAIANCPAGYSFPVYQPIGQLIISQHLSEYLANAVCYIMQATRTLDLGEAGAYIAIEIKRLENLEK